MVVKRQDERPEEGEVVGVANLSAAHSPDQTVILAGFMRTRQLFFNHLARRSCGVESSNWSSVNRHFPKLATIAIGVFAALAFGLSGGAANAATQDSGSAPPPSPEQVSAEIAAIENPALRKAAAALYESIRSEGRDMVGLASADYEPAAGETVARSYPSDCSMAVFISRASQVIYNDTVTSCGSVVSSVAHHLGIKGQNPFNPFDQNTVRDVTYTTYNVSTKTNTTSYACQNSNLTNWFAISNGTVVENGVTYYSPSSVYDELSSVDCGW